MLKEPLNVIVFNTESKVKIGDITYVVRSCFDEKGDTLKEKMGRLLAMEIQNFIPEKYHRKSPKDVV